MALKRQCPEVRKREAQVKSLKRQRPEFREREAQAKALKRQCPEVRKGEAHAKKQSHIKQSSISTCKEAELYQAELYSP